MGEIYELLADDQRIYRVVWHAKGLHFAVAGHI
jgi:hypothetical protein